MATDTIGKLAVVLSANSTLLNAGLTNAQNRVQGFANQVSGLGKVGSFLFSGLGVSIAGITYLLGSFIEKSIEAHKNAEMLGIGTETLIGMQRAANRLGIATEEMTHGLSKMQRHISQAVAGNKEAEATFLQLGVSLDAISNLPVDQQFAVIAQALNKVTNQADKTRLAMELFGRGGMHMIPLFRQATRQLGDFGEAIREIPIPNTRGIQDQLNNIHPPTIEPRLIAPNTEAVQEQLDSLHPPTIRPNLLPPNVAAFSANINAQIEEATRGSRQAQRAFADLGLSLSTLSIQGPMDQIQAVAEALNRIDDPAKRARLSLMLLGESGQELAEVAGRYASGLTAFENAAQRVGIPVDQINDSVSRLGRQINSLSPDTLKALGLEAKDLQGLKPEEAFIRIGTSLLGIPDEAKQAELSIRLFGEQGRALLPIFNRTASLIEKNTQEARRLGLAMSQADLDKFQDFKSSIGKIKDQIANLVTIVAANLAPVVTAFVQVFQRAVAIAKLVLAPIADFIRQLVERIQPSIEAFSDGFIAGVRKVLDVLRPVWEGVMAGFRGLLGSIGPSTDALATFGQTAGIVATVLVGLFVLGKIPAILSLITTGIYAVRAALVALAAHPIVAIITLIAALVLMFVPMEKLKEVAGDVGDKVGTIFKNLGVVLKKVGGTIEVFFVGTLIGAFRVLVEAVNLALMGLSKIPLLGRLFTGASNDVRNFARDLGILHTRIIAEGTRLMNTPWVQGRVRLTDAQRASIASIEREWARRFPHLTPEAIAANRALIADISKTEDELRKQAATFGLSALQIKRHELAIRGATDAQLASIDRLIAGQERLNEEWKAWEEGKRIAEEVRSPLEKYEDEIDRLDRLLRMGMITFETYGRAVANATMELGRFANQALQMPRVELAGSREAFSTINRTQLQQQQTSQGDNIVQRLLAEQRDLQRVQNGIGREIINAIRNQPQPQST